MRILKLTIHKCPGNSEPLNAHPLGSARNQQLDLQVRLAANDLRAKKIGREAPRIRGLHLAQLALLTFPSFLSFWIISLSSQNSFRIERNTTCWILVVLVKCGDPLGDPHWFRSVSFVDLISTKPLTLPQLAKSHQSNITNFSSGESWPPEVQWHNCHRT